MSEFSDHYLKTLSISDKKVKDKNIVGMYKLVTPNSLPARGEDQGKLSEMLVIC